MGYQAAVVAVVRWVAVLPGALLAAGLARVVVGAVNLLTAPYDRGILGEFGIGFSMGGASVCALVVSGASIAPSHKNATGFVLAGMVILIGAVSAGVMATGFPTSVQLSDPMTLGELISTVIAAVYFMVTAWREGRDKGGS